MAKLTLCPHAQVRILIRAVDLHPNLVVNDRVRLIKPLKKGGMGSVWVGYHKTLETQVAVKFMTCNEAAGRQRFAREARAIAKISSPYIVDVKDHGTLEDDTPYIVMELLKGPTLQEYLAERKWMQLEAAVRLVEQLGRGLAAAHAKGVVHRDIKPDNIILIDHDVPEDIGIKLIDFGVAKELLAAQDNELTGVGAMIGTPRYMSPEQIGGAAAADRRADIWGVGAVTYRALTGQDPFVAETLHTLIRKLYGNELRPASEARPELSKAIDEWFARTLAIEPERRFGNAREMARAFRKAIMDGDKRRSTRPPRRAGVKTVALRRPPRPRKRDTPSATNIDLGEGGATLAMDGEQLAAAMLADGLLPPMSSGAEQADAPRATAELPSSGDAGPQRADWKDATIPLSSHVQAEYRRAPAPAAGQRPAAHDDSEDATKVFQTPDSTRKRDAAAGVQLPKVQPHGANVPSHGYGEMTAELPPAYALTGLAPQPAVPAARPAMHSNPLLATSWPPDSNPKVQIGAGALPPSSGSMWPHAVAGRAPWDLNGTVDRPIKDTTTANSVTTSDARRRKMGGLLAVGGGAAAMMAMLAVGAWFYPRGDPPTRIEIEWGRVVRQMNEAVREAVDTEKARDDAKRLAKKKAAKKAKAKEAAAEKAKDAEKSTDKVEGGSQPVWTPRPPPPPPPPSDDF